MKFKINLSFFKKNTHIRDTCLLSSVGEWLGAADHVAVFALLLEYEHLPEGFGVVLQISYPVGSSCHILPLSEIISIVSR